MADPFAGLTPTIKEIDPFAGLTPGGGSSDPFEGLTPSTSKQARGQSITELIKGDIVKGAGSTISKYREVVKEGIVFPVLEGVAEFATSLPGFFAGIMGAVKGGIESLGPEFQITKAGEEEDTGFADLSELYDAMSAGFKAGEGIVPEALKYKPANKAASIIPQTAMAPFEGFRMVWHKLADSELDGEKIYGPNLRGMFRIIGDIGGVIAMKKAYGGGGVNPKLKNNITDVSERAMKIREMHELVENTSNQPLKGIYKRSLKRQAEAMEVEMASKMDQARLSFELKRDLKAKSAKESTQVFKEEGQTPRAFSEQALLKDQLTKERRILKEAEVIERGAAEPDLIRMEEIDKGLGYDEVRKGHTDIPEEAWEGLYKDADRYESAQPEATPGVVGEATLTRVELIKQKAERSRKAKALKKQEEIERQAAYDIQEFLEGPGEEHVTVLPDPDLTVGESLRVSAEVVSDVDTLLLGNVGSFSAFKRSKKTWPLKSPEVAAAKVRLSQNFRLARRIASKTGKTVEQALIHNLGVDPKIAALVANEASLKKGSSSREIIDRIDSVNKAQRAASKKARKYTWDTFKKNTVRHWVDTSGNLDRLLKKNYEDAGADVRMHHDLRRGASSEVMRQVTKNRTKMQKGLSAKEREFGDEMIQSTRIKEIDKYAGFVVTRKPTFATTQAGGKVVKAPAKVLGRYASRKAAMAWVNKKKKPGNYTIEEFKHPGGLTGADHAVRQAAYLDIIKERFGMNDAKARSLLSKLVKREETFFNIMQDNLKALNDKGLMSWKDYDALRKWKYEPRQVIDRIDPQTEWKFESKSVPDSGIKRLKAGTEGALELDSELLMSQVVARTQSRLFKADANRALYDFARHNPENPIVKIINAKQPTPPGHERVTIMISGEPKAMAMPFEMAKEWLKQDPAISHGLAEFAGWFTGAKTLKAAATGYNPGFALTNIPRDIGLVYQATDVYSPHLPKYLAQLGIDYAKVGKDAILRKGRWEDYIKEGGGMDFMTRQGQVAPNMTHKIRVIQDVLSYINNTSEILTRLAIRERGIKSGLTNKQATWEARKYLDFSKWGDWAKAVDSGFPYFNAGIQATRSMARAARDNPKMFSYKAAQIGTISTGIYLANRFVNTEAWEAIPARHKEANFIITTPLSYTDKNGQKRHIYFKIAKDQGQRVFSSIFEGIAARYFEGKYPTDQTLMAINDYASVIPTDKLPPVFDAILGYSLNKNFWMKSDIWKGPKVKPTEEWRYDTHPFFVSAGKATGGSPERIEYALSRFFTYSNPYVAMVGGAYKMASGDLPEEFKERTTLEMIKQVPGIKRVMSSTPAYWKDLREELLEVKTEDSTRKWVHRREFDRKIAQHLQKQSHESLRGVTEFLASIPEVEERKRLMKRVIKANKVKGIPDKFWWLDMTDLGPEARAIYFWQKYRAADDQKKKEMMEIAPKVPGLLSIRFTEKLNMLMKKK